MANLGFKVIPLLAGNEQGPVTLNQSRPNFYSQPFNLSGFLDLPALLFMETQGITLIRNFVTINAPDHQTLNNMSPDDAARVLGDKFVGQLLPAASPGWFLRMFPVKAELVAEGNILGIHSRNPSGGIGDIGGPIDDFLISRVVLIYSASDG
jgi:hypothetical protein